MPTAPPAVPHGLTRRAVLVSTVALGVVTSGCTVRKADQPHAPARRQSPEVDPDVLLAATVLGQEQDLLDTVVATGRRHRELRDLLTATRATHEKHVQLLRDAVPGHADHAAGPTASPTAGASPAPESSTVPHDPRKALRALSRQEDQLSLANKRGAFAAESGAFARVLGSMAAAAAQQSVALGQLSRTAPGRA